MKDSKTGKMLIIISAVLGILALVLISISIFGNFKSNWVLAAGLFCVAIGSICNIIQLVKNKKDR